MNEITKILKNIKQNGGYYTKKSPFLYEAISKGYLEEVRHNIYRVTKDGEYYLESIRLPINTPNQNTAIVKIESTNAVKSIFKNDYFKYIFITVVGGVILYFIFAFFKSIHW